MSGLNLTAEELEVLAVGYANPDDATLRVHYTYVPSAAQLRAREELPKAPPCLKHPWVSDGSSDAVGVSAMSLHEPFSNRSTQVACD